MAHDSLSEIRKRIDELLHDSRPDRYDVHGGDDGIDVEWLNIVADKIAVGLDIEDVLKQFSRNLVRQREGQATKSANKLLRRFALDGQLPLGWWEMDRQPVAIVTRKQRPGGDPEVREERVAVGALTAKDLLAFANEERIRAGRDFSARNAACDGAEQIAEQMLRGQFTHWTAWAEATGPKPEEA